ncbi:MAG TPA: hypothetical protein VF167_08040 [Longimicrobiaceae bacterium]
MALRPGASLESLVEPEQAQDFIDAFLARWGEAPQGKRATTVRSCAPSPEMEEGLMPNR